MTHTDKHNILYPLQYGFRTTKSCETKFLEFIEDVTKNMANSVQTDILILDFSKAFNKVNHNLLTHNLNYYGIQGKTNTWIHNFLSNRTQAVLLEGEASDYIPVMSGVPQWGVQIVRQRWVIFHFHRSSKNSNKVKVSRIHKKDQKLQVDQIS